MRVSAAHLFTPPLSKHRNDPRGKSTSKDIKPSVDLMVIARNKPISLRHTQIYQFMDQVNPDENEKSQGAETHGLRRCSYRSPCVRTVKTH